MTNTAFTFLTFADQKKYKYDRVVKEAKESNYFTHVVAKSLSDMSSSFVALNKKWIERNKRGYGYWVWKGQCIADQLEQMNEGDVLLWSDSGNTVAKGRHHKVREYIDRATKSKTGIVGFRVKYKNYEWNKHDLIDYLIPKDKHEDYYETEQICSGMLLIRKCDESMAIIREWVALSFHRHLIDDSPSVSPNHPRYREHRHDQSILSCLIYVHGADTIDDNWRDGKKSIGILLPIRKK